jgi:hypothetical protein
MNIVATKNLSFLTSFTAVDYSLVARFVSKMTVNVLYNTAKHIIAIMLQQTLSQKGMSH